jgi:hypothetical protein
MTITQQQWNWLMDVKFLSSPVHIRTILDGLSASDRGAVQAVLPQDMLRALEQAEARARARQQHSLAGALDLPEEIQPPISRKAIANLTRLRARAAGTAHDVLAMLGALPEGLQRRALDAMPEAVQQKVMLASRVQVAQRGESSLAGAIEDLSIPLADWPQTLGALDSATDVELGSATDVEMEYADEAAFREAMVYLTQNVLPEQVDAGKDRIESASAGAYMQVAMAYVASLQDWIDASQLSAAIAASVPGYSDEASLVSHGWRDELFHPAMSQAANPEFIWPATADVEMEDLGQEFLGAMTDAGQPPSELDDPVQHYPVASPWLDGSHPATAQPDGLDVIQPDGPALDNIGFADPLGGADGADTVLPVPMDLDGFWNALLASNTGLADVYMDLIEDEGWLGQIATPNPAADGMLSLDLGVEPDNASGFKTTGKRKARQDGDDTQGPAAKRPDWDLPRLEDPAIGAAIAGPFGQVHIQALVPPEPVLLGDEEWLDGNHVDAGMGYLAAQLRRANPQVAARTRFVSVQASLELRALGDEFAQYRQSLVSRFYGEEGQDTADYLFLPINNGVDFFGGSHWSLLFLDRSNRAAPRGYHYDSLPGSGSEQIRIAADLAARLGAGLHYFDGHMAEQSNGYDCGIAVLAATRSMIDRLSGEGLDDAALDLSAVAIDRVAVQGWLGEIQGSPDDEDVDQSMVDAPEADFNAEYDDIFGSPVSSRASTPWLDSLALPSISAAMSRTNRPQAQDGSAPQPSIRPARQQRRATRRTLQQKERPLSDWITDAVRTALETIEAPSEQERQHIARMRNTFLIQLPIRLQDHPSDIQAALLATLRDLPRIIIYDAVLETMAKAVVAFVPSEAVQEEMEGLGLTDERDRKLEGGQLHARALKEAHPTLSIATASWLSGAKEGDLRSDPAFQDGASAAVREEMTRLGLTDERDRKLKGGIKYAKALKEAHPTLSIATASWLSGAKEADLRPDPAFQDGASEAVREEMTRLGLTVEGDRKLKGGQLHARALKEAHPTLSIATASWLSGAKEGDLRSDPAFQDGASEAVQKEMASLGLTDEGNRKLKGGIKYAKALKEAHPTLSIATASWLSGATEAHLRPDPVFQDGASEAVREEMTRLGLTDERDRKLKGGIKYARALKEAHPTLSIATTSWLSGATEAHLRSDPVFQDGASEAVQKEMASLGLTDEGNRKLKGGIKYAKALKEAHPTLSIATTSWLSGAKEANLRPNPAFQDGASAAVREEMTRLGLTDERDRKLKGGQLHARALKEAHPTLSIATASWLSGATEANLRKNPAFR